MTITANDTERLYVEIQHVRQLWIWLFVIGITGLFWYLFVMQIIMGVSLGNQPAPDFLLIVFWMLFGIGMPLLFVSARLITEVRSDGIYIRYIPFHRTYRKIEFRDLQYCELRTYHPILDYGGWGIRGDGHDRAYTVSGNRGVQVECRISGRILIGSRRPEELYQAILMQCNGFQKV